jgi:tellurite resistance protein
MTAEELRAIVDSMLNANNKLIIANLVIACIAIVCVYIVARLKKKGELDEIKSNFKDVLKQQKQLAEATGEIKNSLDKDIIKYQIKLSGYNEKSIDAISDIYTKLVDLRKSALALDGIQAQENKGSFYEAVQEFRNTFDKKKIWIDKELYTYIENIALEIDKRSRRFISAVRNEQLYGARIAPEQMKKFQDTQESFYDFLYQEMNEIFEKIVEKINENVIGGKGEVATRKES